MEDIKPGLYRHYKNKMYRVMGVARHSETLELFVAYQALYESEFGYGALWARPIEMFFEEVEWEGKKLPRFEYVGE